MLICLLIVFEEYFLLVTVILRKFNEPFFLATVYLNLCGIFANIRAMQKILK